MSTPDADSLAIGVDIGGTKIAFALVDRQGQVQREYRLPTDPAGGVEAVLDRVAAGIRVLLPADRAISGVGIGCPGVIDPQAGIVRAAVNLLWQDVPLVEAVQARLKADLDADFPLVLQQDANALTVGEAMFGAAHGVRDYVYLAIGTGLGMGALVDGQLLTGAHHLGLEMGHIALQPGGRLCGCGLRGCPEMYISGVGLLAAVRDYLPDYPTSVLHGCEPLTTADLLNAARDPVQRDDLARRVLDEAAEMLAQVMALCAVVLDPALFVIGGGLGGVLYDLIAPYLLPRVRRRTLPMVGDGLAIKPAQITNSAVGAAALVWYR